MKFELNKDIVFNSIAEKVIRSPDGSKWAVHLETSGQPEVREFDKVVFAHGYQTEPKMPTFEGQEGFEGVIMHSQQYRKPDGFKDKKVIIVGMANTASDIATDLAPHASKVYISHRRGVVIASRYRNGLPVDLSITWQRHKMSWFMQNHFPTLSRKLADTAVAFIMRQQWGKLDPAWRIQPSPSITSTLPAVSETLISLLREGKLASMNEIRRFKGPRSIEFADGEVLDDVDAVICATGYTADFSIAPFVESSSPEGANGRKMIRLYQNLFPPQYANSAAFLNYSAFGKSNGVGFADVIAMALSNIWRGVSPLPSVGEMESDIDAHHKWVIPQLKINPYMDVSKVNQGKWQGFLHDAAGTGMENVGWGLRGWRFWLKDRKMSSLICNGVETPYAFRLFETGKRKTWPGARQAILDVNREVKEFSLKNKK